MLDLIKEYLELFITILTLLPIILGLMASLFKNKKLKLLAEKINFYQEQAEIFIEQAERFIKGGGEKKLEWVLKQIEIKAQEKRISFDAEQVKDIIEKIILLTKKVNV